MLVTVSKLKEDIGVDGDVAAFTAGLGANLGIPGCAGIWPVLLAVFTINQQGISYSAGQYVLLIALTLLVSIGTVGVPGTATITATALFAAAGLPVELIVLFSPISAIVHMARTATNVVGAATVLTAETGFKWSHVDAGIAVENIALLSEELGLGNLIIGCIYDALHGEKGKYFSEKLAIPEGYEFEIAIAVGHKATSKEPHKYNAEAQITVID